MVFGSSSRNGGGGGSEVLWAGEKVCVPVAWIGVGAVSARDRSGKLMYFVVDRDVDLLGRG
jgi:hypothetical protein